MTARLPFMPEGSQALNMAREWTPVIQERIRLWENNEIVDHNYLKMASVNGGRQKKKISFTYTQRQVVAANYAALFRWFGQVLWKLLIQVQKIDILIQIISGKKIATGVGILQDLQAFQFELQIHSVMRQKVSTVIIILVQELVVEALTIQKLSWILQVN